MLLLLGRLDEVEPLIAENLERRSRRYGDDDAETLRAMDLMARFESRRGDHDMALALYGQLLERGDELLGGTHPYTLDALRGQAESLLQLDRAAEAEPLGLELGNRLENAAAEGEAIRANAALMARIYTALDRDDEAREWLRRSEGTP